jgi:hypothetical protein
MRITAESPSRDFHLEGTWLLMRTIKRVVASGSIRELRVFWILPTALKKKRESFKLEYEG